LETNFHLPTKQIEVDGRAEQHPADKKPMFLEKVGDFLGNQIRDCQKSNRDVKYPQTVGDAEENRSSTVYFIDDSPPRMVSFAR